MAGPSDKTGQGSWFILSGMFVAVMSIGIIAACGNGQSLIAATPIDPSKIPPHETVQSPEKQFTSIAWLDEDTLVLTSHKISREFVHPEGGIPKWVTTVEPRVETVDLGSTEFVSLEPLTRSPVDGHDCRPHNERLMRRDVPGSIRLIRSCDYSKDPSRIFWKDSVMHLDLDNGALTFIQELPLSTGLITFSIAPDESRLVIVISGYFVASELYVLAPNAETDLDVEAPGTVRLLSDYLSVKDVHWTSRGITATAKGKGVDPEASLTKILDSKTDLVLIDPDTGAYSILVKGMREAYAVRWSPDNSVLAFSGSIDGEDGIWVYDPVLEDIRLVWPEMARFDWSPSGDRLAILHDPSIFGTSREVFDPDLNAPNYPVIISVTK